MTRKPIADGTFEKTIRIIFVACLLLGFVVVGVVVWALVRVALRLAP